MDNDSLHILITFTPKSKSKSVCYVKKLLTFFTIYFNSLNKSRVWTKTKNQFYIVIKKRKNRFYIIIKKRKRYLKKIKHANFNRFKKSHKQPRLI